MMTDMTQQEFANRYLGANGNVTRACTQAVAWLKAECTDPDGICDLRHAWLDCPRADWMVWAYMAACFPEWRENDGSLGLDCFAEWCANNYEHARIDLSFGKSGHNLVESAVYEACMSPGDPIANITPIADKCRKLLDCPWGAP